MAEEDIRLYGKIRWDWSKDHNAWKVHRADREQCELLPEE